MIRVKWFLLKSEYKYVSLSKSEYVTYHKHKPVEVSCIGDFSDMDDDEYPAQHIKINITTFTTNDIKKDGVILKRPNNKFMEFWCYLFGSKEVYCDGHEGFYQWLKS